MATTPTYASSPWGFRETPLEQQCRWLAEHGMKHICGQFFEGMAGMFPPDQTAEQAAEALARVQSHGLSYASFNLGGDFMVREGVDQQVELACQHIDMAARFKPQVLICFAGWVDRDDDAVYDQVSAALKQVARHAARYNLTVALENHGGLTTTAAQIDRILDAVDEPNIGVNYDPANFEFYGVDPLEALRALRSPIVFTHFKSVKRDDAGKKAYCRLREGYIDYPPILEALLDRGYDGFWTIEYEETRDVFEGSADDLADLRAMLETSFAARA